jgi:phage gp36-like protein
MTYAVKQDMIDRFGEREVIALTDRANTGAVNDAVLGIALAQADAEIEPYLIGKVKLPFVTVPKVLAGYACDIACYRLTGAEVIETETVRNRYKDAIRFLEHVAKGVISLGLDVNNQPAPAQNTVQFTTSSKVFSRDATENA